MLKRPQVNVTLNVANVADGAAWPELGPAEEVALSAADNVELEDASEPGGVSEESEEEEEPFAHSVENDQSDALFVSVRPVNGTIQGSGGSSSNAAQGSSSDFEPSMTAREHAKRQLEYCSDGIPSQNTRAKRSKHAAHVALHMCCP